MAAGEVSAPDDGKRLTAVHYLSQAECDVPSGVEWLSAAEVSRLGSFTVGKRQADWRLGRWTAKRTLAVCLGRGSDLGLLASIEIRPAGDGAPEPFTDGQAVPWSLSISHRDSVAICAVARSSCAVGCDLERIEARSQAFVQDYFAPDEQKLMGRLDAASRPFFATLIWSAKESALKAMRVGLRENPQSALVRLQPGTAVRGWRPLRVEVVASRTYHGWWQTSGELLMTVVCDPQTDAPVAVELALT